MSEAVPRRAGRSGWGRGLWVRLHRYAGLAIALFLTIAGLTGSLLAFGPELDAWLNPRLFHSTGRGPQLPFDQLVQHLETSNPALQVEYLSVEKTPGKAAFAFVSPRTTHAGPPTNLGYDQVFIDPITGEILGQRTRGACCLQPQNLYYFVLHLHHSLFLPGLWGWWLMGGIAIVWLLDCFVGFYLTLPLKAPFWRKWQPAWRLKRGAGSYRLNFDLHRAGGLWLWGLLLVLATSSIALNLKNEVFRPVVAWFSPLAPTPFDTERPLSTQKSVLSFEDVRKQADAEAAARGWQARTSGVFHVQPSGIYIALLWPSHVDRGPGLGEPILYYDAHTGQLLDAAIPGQGSAGDLFVQAQFPLHSGRIIGLPGRILIVLMGLVVALLSVTGVVIWAKKRKARTEGRTGSTRLPPAPQSRYLRGNDRPTEFK